ncbi:MAG: hypothetical protein AAFP19_13120 [Bacteroidota bacterium]
MYVKRLWTGLLLWMTCTLLFSQSNTPSSFKLPKSLPEVSGLYYQDQDSWWWHNDSGRGPILYKTNARGQLLDSIHVPQALNRDWEDLTVDPQGRFYIGDFGNNRNNRQDLCIYRFDPLKGTLDSILFHYPDQKAFPPPKGQRHFDMEAFFWHADTLHLFSKNKPRGKNFYTRYYTLSAEPGRQTAHLKDSLYLKKGVVTAAAISPDGQTIALLAYRQYNILGFIPYLYNRIFYLKAYPKGKFTKGDVYYRRLRGFPVPKQYESVDFLNNQQVAIASEQMVFFRARARLLEVRRARRLKK